MNRSFLYDIFQYNLIKDTWVADLARCLIALVSVFTAALLAKLYHEHKTGRMNKQAAVGAILTYICIGYAQILVLATPGVVQNLTLLNLFVLFAVSLSLFGALKVMRVGLFSKERDSDDTT